jgi:hypothetical protein
VGKLQRSGTIPGVGLVHAPLTLLPSPFPRQAFSQAIELAPLFNRLIDRVSQDADFLQQALARTRKADSFTARLLDIHLQILDKGVKQVCSKSHPFHCFCLFGLRTCLLFLFTSVLLALTKYYSDTCFWTS